MPSLATQGKTHQVIQDLELTGTPTTPTSAPGTGGDQVASQEYADQAAAAAAGAASVTVRKNTGADVGSRPRLNFIEGTGISLTVADDASDGEVDITIGAPGGSVPDWVPDDARTPPVSPNARDDEFDDASGTAIDAAKWTLVNQGASTWVQKRGRLYVTVPAAANFDQRVAVQAPPATPYNLAVLINLQGRAAFHVAGLILRDSATPRHVQFRIGVASGVTAYQMTIDRFAAVTSRNSQPVTNTNQPWSPGGRVWLRVKNDGTTLSCYHSLEGGEEDDAWTLFGTETLATWLSGTINQIGIVANAENASTGFTAMFRHFRVW